jgi:hypothetical protein
MFFRPSIPQKTLYRVTVSKALQRKLYGAYDSWDENATWVAFAGYYSSAPIHDGWKLQCTAGERDKGQYLYTKKIKNEKWVLYQHGSLRRVQSVRTES